MLCRDPGKGHHVTQGYKNGFSRSTRFGKSEKIFERDFTPIPIIDDSNFHKTTRFMPRYVHTSDITLLVITPQNNSLIFSFNSGPISSSLETKSVKNSVISFCSPVLRGCLSIVYVLHNERGLYAFRILS